MTCRSCGAVIADKAIVCYKCGAPTAVDPPPARPRPSRARSPWWLAAALMGAALAGWMAAQTFDVLPRVLWIALSVVLAAGALVGWRRR